MNYHMPLYRPPSEANSIIIQATLGCSHNRCIFCSMYKSKQFKIKDLDVIKKEIDILRQNYKIGERIFIADGDALIIPTKDLKEILTYIKLRFPEVNRITCYATPKSILLKSEDELRELRELGLYMVYMGIETGDDHVLNYIDKGVTSSDMLKAGQRIKKSKILLSVTVLAGIGGTERSLGHSENTGKLISEMNPDFLGVLSLIVDPSTELYKRVRKGEFTTLSNLEVLRELKLMIENITVENKMVFRSNHASNKYVLRGEFPEDKNRLLKEIQKYIRIV